MSIFNRSKRNTPNKKINKEVYPFHRDIYEAVTKSISQNTVTFLLGTRKCGKTVCFKQIEKEIPNTIYVDFKAIATTNEKHKIFDQINASIKNNDNIIYLLDEITYVPEIETAINRIAEALTETNNKNTKIVFTGSQSVAIHAWASRAFAGHNTNIITTGFLTYSEFLRYKGYNEISDKTYSNFLYESADFYNFNSLEEYLKGCIEETIISNSNTSNYIFDNDCDYIKDKVDVLIDICYQTLFTLHNHVNAQTVFKDNKLQTSTISLFRDAVKQLDDAIISDKISNSYIGSYNKIMSQNIDTLKQAFIFLQKCDLINITPVATSFTDIPDVYIDLLSSNSLVKDKNELFKKFNFTIKYPMFYIQILKDILKEDMPSELPTMILGSIVECNARGLLPKGFELRTIDDNAEIDYISDSKDVAVEFTISSKHNNHFELLPKNTKCIMLTKDSYSDENGMLKIPYYQYVHEISSGRLVLPKSKYSLKKKNENEMNSQQKSEKMYIENTSCFSHEEDPFSGPK